ncbi:MAG TPA: DUF1801 domain-containing protein [Phaeodactylibacter sp.]|nr:DUF1801 domain-containing protein [Phaeodactylibacter sp.]
MSKLKTQPNAREVAHFLEQVEDEQQRADSSTILQMMETATGEKAKMWGKSIVGFGQYHYKYDSGREGDWFITGFAPRKRQLSLYIMSGFDQYEALLQKLGKHKTGKSCLYIKRLDDIDKSVLRTLIEQSVQYMREKYPAQ